LKISPFVSDCNNPLRQDEISVPEVNDTMYQIRRLEEVPALSKAMPLKSILHILLSTILLSGISLYYINHIMLKNT